MLKLSGLSLALASVVLVVVAGCPGRDPTTAEGEGEGEGEGDLPAACALDTNRPVAAAPGSIYFGTRTPTLVPLDAAQQNAVVAISDTVTDGAFCSGTLISDDVVMTAVHCTVDDSAVSLRVLFGADDLHPILTLNVLEKHETDADTDVSILTLEHAPADDIPVTPIPIAVDPPQNDDVGVLVENAGFGENEDGGFAGRFFVTELLDGFDRAFIQVNGEGQRGVCFGDSGGPSFRVTAAGDVRVLGALSFGDAECTFVDNYARADAIRSFIEDVTGPTPVAASQACPADVTAEGSCDVHQGIATYCEAGVVVHDACGVGDICGADASGNKRCVPIADNACGAVSGYGTCDGQTLTWCDGGAVKERDCEACGERCALLSPDEGFSCVPSDCGDLDRLGECDGAVSKWCDALGQVVTEDCGAEGTTCEFLGDVLGNYCLDQDACQGFDYQGACDGTVLTWCEDNALNTVDCADTGGTCIHVDDATGFDCSQ